MMRFLLLLLLVASASAERIQGQACYRYGDGESLVEARLASKALALRDAVEGAAVFVEASSTIEDYRLREDLVEALSVGFLTDCEESVETDREAARVCTRVACDVDPDQLRRFLEGVALERRQRAGLPGNDCLQVLALNRAPSPDGTRQRFTAVVKVLDPGACDEGARTVSLLYLDGDGRIVGGATRGLAGRLRTGGILELGFDTRLETMGAEVELVETGPGGSDGEWPGELQQAVERFQAAIESGDVEARIALLADDARLLPDHGEPIQGREAIAARWRASRDSVFRLRDRRELGRIVDGGLACLSASYEHTWHAPDEPARWHRTKNLHVWIRDGNGAWRLWADIWNSDLPPADFLEEGWSKVPVLPEVGE